MAQNKSSTGAEPELPTLVPPNPIEHELTTPPQITVELLRRPIDNGVFGTISFKVAITGGTVEETMRLLDETTKQVEKAYAQNMTMRIRHVP